MEGAELPFLSCAQDPGLTAVQKGAHNASSVDLDLGVPVRPYSLSRSGHGGNSLADLLV